MSKDFENTVSNIKRISHDSSPEVAKIWNNRDKKIIQKTTSKMENDIRKAMNKNNFYPDNENELIKDVTMILNKMLSKKITEKFTEKNNVLVYDYIKLVSNWNSMVDCEQLEHKIKALVNLKNYHQSVVETTKYMKKLISYVKKFESLNIPTYDMSENYLRSLQKDIEE